MEVTRIDPYLVRWSSDSVLALATESSSVEFLFPDAIALLNGGSLKFTRAKAPEDMPKGRVLDMQWSPTFTGSGSGCCLACVLDSGVVAILETGVSDAALLHTIEGENLCSVAWMESELIAGDASGAIHKINIGQRSEAGERFPLGPGLPITYLTVADQQIGATLSDNSAWVSDDMKVWRMVTGPSRFSVISARFIDKKLYTLRCGKLFAENKVIELSTCLPGIILPSPGGCVIIHTDGSRSNVSSPSLTLPQIQGDVLTAQIHPVLPMGLVVLSTGSAANSFGDSQPWKFPIHSSQSVTIYLFPLQGQLDAHRSQCDAVSAWLLFLVQGKMPTVSFNPEIDGPSCVARIDKSQSLVDQLRELFRSDYYDKLRIKWFLSNDDDRKESVKIMRASIAQIISQFPAKSSVDKLVVSFYNHSANDTFSLNGDFIEENFASQHQIDAFTMKSVEGRIWKRCALTLLPILCLNVRHSAERHFTAIQASPVELNGKPSKPNLIADALLEAANFCIYTGTRWQ